MKLSDYLMQRLVEAGVGHVFMLPGGGAMYLNDSLGRCSGLEYVVNLHEQACAIAADAYSQYSGNLGVCLVTTGPGGTNTLTGVAASWLDSIPVLIVSGQVKRADLAPGRGLRQLGFQELDIVSIVKPITKYAVTVTEPELIRYHCEKALYLARSGRPGPVWLDIPLDVQAAEIEPARLPAFIPPAVSPVSENLTSAVGRLVGLLATARRPVILAGNGIRLAGALADFLELIERLRIPILTTWKAIDFLPEEHPLYAGRPGAVGQRGANFTQQNADCLITLGARLDYGQTAYNHAHFGRKARKVIIDIDPAELKKIDPAPELAVAADAGLFIRELARQLKAFVRPAEWDGWLEQTQAWRRRYPVVLDEYRRPENEFVNDYYLIDLLSELMRPDDLLVPGSSGACSERTMQAFKVKKGQRIFNSQGLGSMGFGLPAALGGCIAAGRRRTVLIEGDGGFSMNLQELETVRRLDLPLKIFILNNRGYGSIRTTQKNYFAGRLFASCEAGGLTLPDWERIAHGFSLPFQRLAEQRDLKSRLAAILDRPGPVCIEVMVSPDQPTMPRVTSRPTPDGGMETAPMEDLYPLLEREELAENILNDDWKGR
jgi:acetolactate synthase-1/2/3 large subunit